MFFTKQQSIVHTLQITVHYKVGSLSWEQMPSCRPKNAKLTWTTACQNQKLSVEVLNKDSTNINIVPRRAHEGTTANFETNSRGNNRVLAF